MPAAVLPSLVPEHFSLSKPTSKPVSSRKATLLLLLWPGLATCGHILVSAAPCSSQRSRQIWARLRHASPAFLPLVAQLGGWFMPAKKSICSTTSVASERGRMLGKAPRGSGQHPLVSLHLLWIWRIGNHLPFLLSARKGWAGQELNEPESGEDSGCYRR